MAKPIALQLYSLRSDVYSGGGDLPGVLKTVAQIGYKGVELCGLHGTEPRELANMLSDCGLVACSTHQGLPGAEDIGKFADDYSQLAVRRAIAMFGPDSLKGLDDAKIAASKLQKDADRLKPYGMTLGYHNHWWEFAQVGDKYVFDVLLSEAPDLFSELDTYWCAFAKSSPMMAVKAYKQRMPLLHIKDGLLIEGSHVHTAVGSGKMDVPSIISSADPDVLEWVIVELDACETDMLEAVEQSYAYLTSAGLAEGNR